MIVGEEERGVVGYGSYRIAGRLSRREAGAGAAGRSTNVVTDGGLCRADGKRTVQKETPHGLGRANSLRLGRSATRPSHLAAAIGPGDATV